MKKIGLIYPVVVGAFLLVLLGCSSMNAINKASTSGSLHKMIVLLDSGSDVNEDQPLYGTPLLIAVEGGDVEMAKLLIKRGADVTYIDQSSQSLLSVAVKKRDALMVRLLISAGADINEDSFLHVSILARFAGEGDLDTVRFLLTNGADIKRGYPVSLAARGGHLKVARFLISKGADVSCPPRYGFYGLSTIEQAVESGSIDMVTLILSAGAEPNCGDAVQLASSRENKDIYKKLVHAGATP